MPLMSTWPRMTRRGKSVGVTNFFEALGKLCDKSHPQRTLGFQVLPIRSWKHDPLPSEFSNGYICLGCAMSCAEIQWPYVDATLHSVQDFEDQILHNFSDTYFNCYLFQHLHSAVNRLV